MIFIAAKLGILAKHDLQKTIASFEKKRVKLSSSTGQKTPKGRTSQSSSEAIG